MGFTYARLCILAIAACRSPKPAAPTATTESMFGFDPKSIAKLEMTKQDGDRLCEGEVASLELLAYTAAGEIIPTSRLNTASTDGDKDTESITFNTIEVKTTPPTSKPVSCFDGKCLIEAPEITEELVIEVRVRGSSVAAEPRTYRRGTGCVVRAQVLAINRSGGPGNPGEDGIISTDNGGTGHRGYDAPKPQQATVEATWVISPAIGKALLVVADRMLDDEDKENFILVKAGRPAKVSGNGGRGGDGGTGGNGVAMKGDCSPGRGGDGGNGGNGGDGSKLIVRASAQDVLDGLAITVEGGKGGNGGAGGRGGQCGGGPRGSTGSPGSSGSDGAAGSVVTKVVPVGSLTLIQAHLKKHPDLELAK